MIPKTESFTVKRATRLADEYGGQTETFNSVGTLPGHLQNLDQREMIELNKLDIKATHKFFLESFDLSSDD
jgi:head-tail adaptor